MSLTWNPLIIERLERPATSFDFRDGSEIKALCCVLLAVLVVLSFPAFLS